MSSTKGSSSFKSKLAAAAKTIANTDPIALAKQLSDLQNEFKAYGQKAAQTAAKFCIRKLDRAPKCVQLAGLLTGEAASEGIASPALIAWISGNLDFILEFIREVGPEVFGDDVMKKWGLSKDDLATVDKFKQALAQKADTVCQYGPAVACRAARALVGVSVTASKIAGMAAKPST